MNGQKQEQKKKAAAAKAASMAAGASSAKGGAINGPGNEAALESEVTTLKKRIEEMNKNIDQLTSMVEKVTLAQKAPTSPSPAQQQETTVVNQNNKRAKIDTPVTAPTTPSSPLVPDEPVSGRLGSLLSPTPDSMELDDLAMMPPSIPSPIRETKRDTSSGTELSDEGFVDQLFTAFGSGDMEFSDDDATESVVPTQLDSSSKSSSRNPPRPELMERLSEALALLPSDIQEMIVERLIQSITAPKEIQESVKAVEASDMAPSMTVPQSPRPDKETQKEVNLGLAAATLAALLQHFGDAESSKTKKAPSAAHNGKALLIPVHA